MTALRKNRKRKRSEYKNAEQEARLERHFNEWLKTELEGIRDGEDIPGRKGTEKGTEKGLKRNL